VVQLVKPRAIRPRQAEGARVQAGRQDDDLPRLQRRHRLGHEVVEHARADGDIGVVAQIWTARHVGRLGDAVHEREDLRAGQHRRPGVVEQAIRARTRGRGRPR